MQRVLSPTRYTTEALKSHRMLGKSKFAISSGWHNNIAVIHPDEILT